MGPPSSRPVPPLLQNGAAQLAPGASALAEGATQLATGTTELAGGAADLGDGAMQVMTGTYSLADGVAMLGDGAREAGSGTPLLADGATSLADGAGELANGIGQLGDGASELGDGLTTAVDQLPSFEGDEATNVASVVRAPVGTDDNGLSLFGSGAIPLLAAIVLWFGSLATFLAFRPVTSRALTSAGRRSRSPCAGSCRAGSWGSSRASSFRASWCGSATTRPRSRGRSWASPPRPGSRSPRSIRPSRRCLEG